jgi:hypothetical protein
VKILKYIPALSSTILETCSTHMFQRSFSQQKNLKGKTEEEK